MFAYVFKKFENLVDNYPEEQSQTFQYLPIVFFVCFVTCCLICEIVAFLLYLVTIFLATTFKFSPIFFFSPSLGEIMFASFTLAVCVTYYGYYSGKERSAYMISILGRMPPRVYGQGPIYLIPFITKIVDVSNTLSRTMSFAAKVTQYPEGALRCVRGEVFFSIDGKQGFLAQFNRGEDHCYKFLNAAYLSLIRAIGAKEGYTEFNLRDNIPLSEEFIQKVRRVFPVIFNPEEFVLTSHELCDSAQERAMLDRAVQVFKNEIFSSRASAWKKVKEEFPEFDFDLFERHMEIDSGKLTPDYKLHEFKGNLPPAIIADI